MEPLSSAFAVAAPMRLCYHSSSTCGHRQVVRQRLPKPSSAGSNPVARSRATDRPFRGPKLAQEICRDDLDYFESAEMLVWEVARHEGFVIPDYPLASNSEVKAFLKEYNARDVADWYQKRGVLRSSYDQFWKSSALMARNRTFWRKVIVFPKSDMDDANLLARDLCVAVTFCMGKEDGERDSRLFSI